MKELFIKPDLKMYFDAMPIRVWLNADYDKANTPQQLADVVHKWLGIAENTKDELKKHCYEIAAYNLYSILTKRTYQSQLGYGINN